MKISIIIPAYNEEKRISNTLKTYLTFFRDISKKNKIDYEILVVINNTTDRTESLVKNIARADNHLRYLNLKPGGKGLAIIAGFKDALKRKNDLIGFVDADMATSPEAFYDLIKNIDIYDGIIASRYIKGAIVNPKQSLKRIISSRIYNLFLRVLFLIPYQDTQCGAKVFKRMAIEKVINSLVITKWAFDIDLIYQLRKNNMKIREFPTVWSDKEYSKINFIKAGPRMALAAIRLRLINSRFKFLIRGYDLLPDWMKITIWIK